MIMWCGSKSPSVTVLGEWNRKKEKRQPLNDKRQVSRLYVNKYIILEMRKEQKSRTQHLSSALEKMNRTEAQVLVED